MLINALLLSIVLLFLTTTTKLYTDDLKVFLYYMFSASDTGHGARCLNDTVDSHLSWCIGWIWFSSTSSTRGSFLFLMNKQRSIDPGLVNQVGREVPKEDHLSKLKNCSCGMELVTVDRNDLMECRVLESTDSHWWSFRFFDLRVSLIVFQMIPLYLSACLLQLGL